MTRGKTQPVRTDVLCGLKSRGAGWSGLLQNLRDPCKMKMQDSRQQNRPPGPGQLRRGSRAVWTLARAASSECLPASLAFASRACSRGHRWEAGVPPYWASRRGHLSIFTWQWVPRVHNDRDSEGDREVGRENEGHEAAFSSQNVVKCT